MKQYDITVKRDDLRWLDFKGSEYVTRRKDASVFRSSVTDQAKKLIETNGLYGSYMRHLSTGHAETEWISLAMLYFADRYDGIVGVTLESLAKDKAAQSIIGLPTGRILYELLEEPRAFRVSTDQGIEIPPFNDDYAVIDTYEGRLFGGMKFVPQKSDISPNKQAEKIKKNVYIEFQPGFVAHLGSVDMSYGSFKIDSYRAMAQRAKESQQTEPGLMDRILNIFGN